MKTADTQKKTELLEKAKELVDEVIIRMDDFGVTRLGPVYINNYHNTTHGTQTRLHIDSDDNESDLVFCRKASNDNRIYYEFGDLNLPYTKPTLDTVFDFLDSIDEINGAIENLNSKINEYAIANKTIN